MGIYNTFLDDKTYKDNITAIRQCVVSEYISFQLYLHSINNFYRNINLLEYNNLNPNDICNLNIQSKLNLDVYFIFKKTYSNDKIDFIKARYNIYIPIYLDLYKTKILLLNKSKKYNFRNFITNFEKNLFFKNNFYLLEILFIFSDITGWNTIDHVDKTNLVYSFKARLENSIFKILGKNSDITNIKLAIFFTDFDVNKDVLINKEFINSLLESKLQEGFKKSTLSVKDQINSLDSTELDLLFDRTLYKLSFNILEKLLCIENILKNP
jgi:hypothetical protein